MPNISKVKDTSVVLVACSPVTAGSEVATLPAPRPTDNAPQAAAYLPGSTATALVRTGASSASGLLERLAQEVLQRGGYLSVEAGYCQQGFPSLEQGVERAIARGAQRIIAVPVSPALLRSSAGECLAGSWQDSVHSRIHAIRLHYAEIEIVYAAPPFDLQRLADLVVSKAREYEPISYQTGPCNLHELTTGETALVCSIAGGGHFRSRMASLGFTPGALVKMVQNYGHGAVIVSLRGTRVALGRGEARKVGISRGNHHGQPGL